MLAAKYMAPIKEDCTVAMYMAQIPRDWMLAPPAPRPVTMPPLDPPQKVEPAENDLRELLTMLEAAQSAFSAMTEAGMRLLVKAGEIKERQRARLAKEQGR